MSEAEIFLNSIRCLDLEIKALDAEKYSFSERRKNLFDKAENISSNINGICVQTGTSDKTGSIGAQLASLPTPEEYCKRMNGYKSTLNRMTDELVNRKQKALDVIAKIDDPKLGALLINRYILNKKWGKIADILGMSQDWVETRLRKQAIKAYEEAECGKQPNLS